MSTITREFTKEQLIEHIKGRKDFADECAADSTLHPERREYYELTAEALRIALASLEAEPVAWLWSHRKYPSEVTLVRPEDDERAEGAHWSGWSCKALYSAPPAPVSMKDHQIRELVNELRDIAIEYHGTQQLRERIARTIRAAMLQGADGK